MSKRKPLVNHRCICGRHRDGWVICMKHWGNKPWIRKLIKEFKGRFLKEE